MCGIFGIIGQSHNNLAYIKSLSRHAKRRGQDSSGVMMFQDEYSVQRADFDISKLTKDLRIKNPEIFLGIGRLITNDNQAKQPFLSDDICVFHNGIDDNGNGFVDENLDWGSGDFTDWTGPNIGDGVDNRPFPDAEAGSPIIDSLMVAEALDAPYGRYFFDNETLTRKN